MCFHRRLTQLWLTLVIVLCPLPVAPALAQSDAPTPLCYSNHWRPQDTLLKDHSLFRYNDFYYLVSIHIPTEPNAPHAQHFAYARTKDFCSWEDLGTILELGPAGAPDEAQIWAPHVISFGQTWYMFYTGVNRNVAQVIMLATSTNPADPASWKRQGEVFRPTHKEAYYPGPQYWSDARDPMVLYDWPTRQYIMYYSAYDQAGCPAKLKICGIIGVATAARLDGPWKDQGAVLKLDTPGIPESAYVVAPGIGGTYYLFFNHAVQSGLGGQKVVMSTSATGPWTAAERFLPGWASDFFQASDGWVMSYLGNYTVAVTRLIWNTAYTPARPMSINERRVYLSAVMH